MYPMHGSLPDDKPRSALPVCSPVLHAVCPDCGVAGVVTQIPLSDVTLALYHSCARCHLVWATDSRGTPINKH